MGRRDIISGIILLLLSTIIGATALRYGYKAEYGPGPGFIPFWLATMLGIMSTILIANGFWTRKKNINPELQMFSNPKVFFSALGTLLIVAAVLDFLGFVITVAFSTTIFVKLIKPDHRWSRALYIGVVSSVAMYSFFTFVMSINLPKGVLPI